MLAADLVRRQVAVIASGGIVAAIAAKSATTTISIVIQIGDNPVRLGLVVGSSRRGGNITGVTSLNVEGVPKLLDLLHELVSTASVIALRVNPASPTQTEATTIEAQVPAQKLGLKQPCRTRRHRAL